MFILTSLQKHRTIFARYGRFGRWGIPPGWSPPHSSHDVCLPHGEIYLSAWSEWLYRKPDGLGLIGVHWGFILLLSWTSFFSPKWPCDIIRLSTFIHGPYFTLNEPSLLPAVLTLQVILRKTTLTSRYLLYYCILASSLFFSLSCHTLISKIILYHF